MEATNEAILGWTRVGVLLLGLGWAAWMVHKDRRVPNEHWIVWTKPALSIWALDLMVQGADWTIYLTAAAVVAYASVSVFGRPTLGDAINGSWMDRSFLLWYLAGGIGVVAGALEYQSTTPLDVLLNEGDPLGMLWWKTASLFSVILLIGCFAEMLPAHILEVMSNNTLLFSGSIVLCAWVAGANAWFVRNVRKELA